MARSDEEREERWEATFERLSLEDMKTISDLELKGETIKNWRLLLQRLFTVGKISDATDVDNVKRIFNRAGIPGLVVLPPEATRPADVVHAIGISHLS